MISDNLQSYKRAVRGTKEASSEQHTTSQLNYKTIPTYSLNFTSTKEMATTTNITTCGNSMAGKLFLFLLASPWQFASAMPASSTNDTNNSYHYGYDDGSRSTLLQLYDGLSIQDLIQSSPGGLNGVRLCPLQA